MTTAPKRVPIARRSVLAAVLALASCAAPDLGRVTLPGDFYAMYDKSGLAPMFLDESALYDAGIVLGNNGPRTVDPPRAAHAAASVEYLAWAMNHDPYWIGVESIATQYMVMARDELRAAIGARPDAPAQDVVNALVAASRAPTPDAMATALNVPAFPAGGAATFERIRTLPRLPAVDRAIPRAARARFYLNAPNDHGRNSVWFNQ